MCNMQIQNYILSDMNHKSLTFKTKEKVLNEIQRPCFAYENAKSNTKPTRLTKMIYINKHHSYKKV